MLYARCQVRVRTVALLLALLSLGLTTPCLAGGDTDPVVERSLGNFVDRYQTFTALLILDPEVNLALSSIVQRLSSGCPREDLSFRVRVINSPVINAYAASGGFIYVNSGLLDILESPDELAGVLAHEVAHVCQSHSIKTIRSAYHKRATGQWAGFILGTIAGAYANSTLSRGGNNYADLTGIGQFLGGRIGESLAEFSLKGYSKELEIEADDLAVVYMHKAGYDPYALLGVFKKLKQFRDQLAVADRNRYRSALVNKEPGLENRIFRLQGKIHAIISDKTEH